MQCNEFQSILVGAAVLLVPLIISSKTQTNHNTASTTLRLSTIYGLEVLNFQNVQNDKHTSIMSISCISTEDNRKSPMLFWKIFHKTLKKYNKPKEGTLSELKFTFQVFNTKTIVFTDSQNILTLILTFIILLILYIITHHILG